MPPPRYACGIDTHSSIAIRKLLLADAIAAIGEAGPLGLGLNALQRRNCLGMPPHNTAVRALAELGWFAGAALVALLVMVPWRLWPIARHNPAAAFLLCALAYITALSMVHGQLSRDVTLFLLLGAGVAASVPRREDS
ncbi:O-antigen ligase [Bradyrhizobium sp. AZCC 1578]|uniref:hypothetical protein n=1 Tax=Bradyrhizobium sp. AZCC 1578 TaxID=3117027 RepID=UPI002FF09A26